MTQAQTIFARELAKGTDRETAYRTAYPAAHDMRPATLAAKASALAASPAIVAAVDRLRGADRDGDAAGDETGETMDADEAARLLTATARRIHAEEGRPADLARILGLLADLQGWRRPEPEPEGITGYDLTQEELADSNRRTMYGLDGPRDPEEIRAESLRLADAVRRSRAIGA